MIGALCAALTLVAAAALAAPGSASAAACATTTGASGCTVTANLTVTAGTLTLESSPNLYWSFAGTGYDQWASGSATALSGCSVSGSATHCSGGTAPTLLVLDASGSSGGWNLSEYLSSNTLPSGAVLHFNGAGSSTIGYSQASPVATDPFTATAPSVVCDFASTCTAATAAGTYAVTVGGTAPGSQVALYSATANTGLGANCFGSGTATATGCTGVTGSGFFNLGIRSNAPAGSTSATINMAANSGP